MSRLQAPRPRGQPCDLPLELRELRAQFGHLSVDVVGRYPFRLSVQRFRVDLEPPLDFVLDRRAPAAQGAFLRLPSGERCLLLVALPLEVLEHDLGPGEEGADVLPDERLEQVGADAWAVAGEAALVVVPVAGTAVAADGAVLDSLVSRAAVGVAAGSAADLPLEWVVVALAAAVAGAPLSEAELRLLVTFAGDDRRHRPGDKRPRPARPLSVDALAAVERAAQDALQSEPCQQRLVFLVRLPRARAEVGLRSSWFGGAMPSSFKRRWIA